MNNENLTLKYSLHFSSLGKIVNSWNFIPESPDDEFDYLNNKILSQLYKSPDSENLNRILQTELINYYGIYTKNFDSERFISEIINWWNLIKEIDQKTADEEILVGTTVNERLYLTNLIDLFDRNLKEDKIISTYILQKLKVDNDSIKKIIKDCT